jgi:hypothetical protein
VEGYRDNGIKRFPREARIAHRSKKEIAECRSQCPIAAILETFDQLFSYPRVTARGDD